WPSMDRGDNLNDARASENCFPRNRNPEPQRLLYQQRQYLDRAPERERRPGAVLLPCYEGLGAALVWRSLYFGMVINLSLTTANLRSPENEELERKKAVLAELEAQLADRELELASCLAELVHFEKRYMQTVGRLYAILDDLKAKIAEAIAEQN